MAGPSARPDRQRPGPATQPSHRRDDGHPQHVPRATGRGRARGRRTCRLRPRAQHCHADTRRDPGRRDAAGLLLRGPDPAGFRGSRRPARASTVSSRSSWWAGRFRRMGSMWSAQPTTRARAQAVDYLAGLGHRRIAYVDGGRGAISAGRRRGYQRAMRGLRLGAHVQVIPATAPRSPVLVRHGSSPTRHRRPPS